MTNTRPLDPPVWGEAIPVDDHTDPTAQLARLLALHEKQSNLADPENLPKVASALASGLVGALRNAVKPSEPAPAGRLTAWSPAAAALDATSRVPDGDGG